MAIRAVKWRPNFLGGWPQVSGVNMPRKYAADITGTGSGVVVITHGLNTLDIIASIRRITVVNSIPVGDTDIRWWPSAVNDISIDFDTYVRASAEFRVVVIG